MASSKSKILKGEICPYCDSETTLVKDFVVYAGGYGGHVIVCERYPDCDSYVGTHKATKKPLGRLADKKLRKAKIKAHNAFDVMWKKANKIRGGNWRRKAYAWLANEMDIEVDKCHIGMFDLAQCNEVIKICNEPI